VDTGERLKSMREAKNWSVAEMAEKLKCSRQTVYNIEANINTSFDIVRKWVWLTEPDPLVVLDLFSEDNIEQNPVLPQWLAKILPHHWLKSLKGETDGYQHPLPEQGNDGITEPEPRGDSKPSRFWDRAIGKR
jgi:DNA-binding XRE family transcriptional regulator